CYPRTWRAPAPVSPWGRMVKFLKVNDIFLGGLFWLSPAEPTARGPEPAALLRPLGSFQPLQLGLVGQRELSREEFVELVLGLVGDFGIHRLVGLPIARLAVLEKAHTATLADGFLEHLRVKPFEHAFQRRLH